VSLVPFYLTKMPFYLLYIITFITNYISRSLLILQWEREEMRFKIKMNKKHLHKATVIVYVSKL